MKRKTYQETNEKDESSITLSSNLSHLLASGLYQSEIEARAQLALTKMLAVKDSSIQAFIKSFIVDAPESEDLILRLKSQFSNSLNLQTTLCSELG